MKRLLMLLVVLLLVPPALPATIEVTIKVDSSITSQLGQVCDRLRVRNGYTSNGWNNTEECAQAIFNQGVLTVSAIEASDDATAVAQVCYVDRTNQLMDPLEAGIDLNEPPKWECGDAYVDVDFGEQCDDGNTVDGDGCQGNCLAPRCGDNIVDAFPPLNEQCDDGNNFNNDGCSATCQTE